MDLSKAFHCLPHDTLLSKLAAYELSSQSVTRKLFDRPQATNQGVVIGWHFTEMCSPRSIMGLLLLYFIEHGTLYNYADDNTSSYAYQDYNTLINVLENINSILIEWFN